MENENNIFKDDCIFCKIIKGELPCYRIFENDKILAYLDIFPANLGHTLIIPKKHQENIFDIDEEILQEITKQSKIIATNLKTNLPCDGITILQSNGKAATQLVNHYHMHIIPRYNQDNMVVKFNSKPSPITLEQGNETLEKIKLN